MQEGQYLESLIKEYEGILQTIQPEGRGANALMRAAVEALHHSGDWTEHGADQIVGLVRAYGTFMLRNALALAVVLGIEDGDLGF